jgi:NAD(P)-dependent dehydrogenase (short-subunit alcohol dehydrogenase family)
MSLAGQTILITGAAGGLGSALSEACAAKGANLVLLDKNHRNLNKLSDRITESGSPPPGLYPLDLAAAGIDEFNAMVEVIQAEYGGLDSLIHCAMDFEGLQPLDQIEPHHWLKSMQVNLNAPWLLSCTCLPLLKNSNSGRLFFLLDDTEKVTDAYWGAYGTAKTALVGLVRQFDASLSNTGVLVKGIFPGAMRTAFRAMVYHAENPMEQPEPTIAAGKIVDLLTAELAGTELIIKLV